MKRYGRRQSEVFLSEMVSPTEARHARGAAEVLDAFSVRPRAHRCDLHALTV